MIASASTEVIPSWDLNDLYNNPDDPKLKQDLGHSAKGAKSFADKYQGKLADLDGAGLGQAIQEYEDLGEVLSRVMSYAQLLFAAHAEDSEVAAFYQNMNERATEISSDTLFFELELNRIEDEKLTSQLKDPSAAKYAPWLDTIRIFKPYQLSDELEKLLHEKCGWSGKQFRLFNEIPTLLLFSIVFLVVFKEAFSWTVFLLILAGLILVIGVTVNLLAKRRQKEAAGKNQN